MYTIHTNAGKNRKPLVNTLTNMFGHKPDYAGAPTFAYDFGTCKLDRNGTLMLAPFLNESAADKLAMLLVESGFDCCIEHIDDAPVSSEIETGTDSKAAETDDLIFALHVPKSALPDAAFSRFCSLVAGKQQLICKALGTEALPIEESEDEYLLPWFGSCAPEDRKAYELFISKLVALANRQKRALDREKPVFNEKYQFRCFLLRLGFIGTQYKAERAVLLRNLSGNSAFHCGYDPRKESEKGLTIAQPESTEVTPVII